MFNILYCVNKNIASRISACRFLERKIIVAENGGFGELIDKSFFENKNYNQIKCLNIVFYGSLQDHYAIDEFLCYTRKFLDEEQNRKIHIHFIGPNFPDFGYNFVTRKDSMNRYEFASYIKSLGLYVYGIIPLKNIGLKKDTLPIKYFDYVSCGLPIIISYLPKVKFSQSKTLFFDYNIDDYFSFRTALNKCFILSPE